MTISEFEKKRFSHIIENYLNEIQLPNHLQLGTQIDYKITNQSIELFEIRPVYKGKPGETYELPIIKTTYVKSKNIWKIFWQRRDLKWHSYEPNPVVKTLEEFIAILKKDEYGCFYG